MCDHSVRLDYGYLLSGLLQEVLEEMNRFRGALKKYYNSKDLSCVSFERNFKSQHLQIQVSVCLSACLSPLHNITTAIHLVFYHS